jgi:hypothetical protein
MGLLNRMVGQRSRIPKLELIRKGTEFILSKVARAVGVQRRLRGTKLLSSLLGSAAKRQFPKHQAVLGAIRHGTAPLAEHEAMFALVSAMNRDATAGIIEAIAAAADDSSLGEIFDIISAILAQQTILLPYYFALFHQNQERDLLKHLAGGASSAPLRVGFFTDVLEGHSATAVFARGVKQFAASENANLTVLNSSTMQGRPEVALRNFAPLWSGSIKQWPEKIALPPVLEVLQFADEKQFDVIVTNTCGPMGLCALLAAKMLKAPVIALDHDDIAARVFARTNGDHRLTAIARSYTNWFFSQAAKRQCQDAKTLWRECSRLVSQPARSETQECADVSQTSSLEEIFE